MNTILKTCHSSLNQWWKKGLRTNCLNWPFKFNSKRLVNGNSALKKKKKNLQKERTMFCGPFVLWCGSFKLLIFKISTFYWKQLDKNLSQNLRPIKKTLMKNKNVTVRYNPCFNKKKTVSMN